MSIDKLTDKLAEIATIMQGPGFDAARAAARVEGYSALTSGAMCGVIAVGIGLAMRWLFMSERGKQLDEFIHVMAGILGGIALCILVPATIWAFIDPWVWTAISQPELWLAKKALKL